VEERIGERASQPSCPTGHQRDTPIGCSHGHIMAGVG
jgi:hypothetical protein